MLQKLITDGRGVMMGFPNLTNTELKSLSAYLLSDYSISIPEKDLQEPSRKALPYSVNIAGRFLNEDAYPAVAPPWGTLEEQLTLIKEKFYGKFLWWI